MLLITRRTGESIIINGSIEVKVVEVTGGRVKLGFEYPEGNTVYRQELFAKIQEENRAAAAGNVNTSALENLLRKK
ncbi:MAG: carbon storage regulator [Alphaproteobacteria bacterium]